MSMQWRLRRKWPSAKCLLISETWHARYRPSLYGDRLTTPANPRGSAGFYEIQSINRVKITAKNSLNRGNDFGVLGVIPAAGYPPAPLTGNVGRGCGDASRALLLFKIRIQCSGINGFVSGRGTVFRRGVVSSGERIQYLQYAYATLTPPLASCCASCAGRTGPGWRQPRPSRAGTAWRSGTPVQGVRRSGSVRDRR
jgi:hypothetical protein